MRTIFVCHKCGAGFTGVTAGMLHAGPMWQWPLANQFGPNCGGTIEAKIITREA